MYTALQMNVALPTGGSRSEPGLDVFRAVAVFMMFVVHSRRLQPSLSRTGSGPGEASLEFFMLIEPYVASTFLFVAGVSLVLSWENARDPSAWLRRMLRRALGLYAISIGLFVLQYGVDLPDLLLSSGILSCLAEAIAITAAPLRSEQRGMALFALFTLGIALSAALERVGASVSGLNAGPGGAIPLLSHAALGAFAALVLKHHGRAGLWRFVALSVPLTLVVVWLGLDWTREVTSYYRELDGRVAVLALFEPGFAATPRAPIVFWNHSSWGALALMAPLLSSLAISVSLPRRFGATRALQPVLLVGRHALLAYVAHLGVLGLLDVAGLGPPNSTATWSLVLALCVMSVALSWAVERLPRAPRRAATTRDAATRQAGGL